MALLNQLENGGPTKALEIIKGGFRDLLGPFSFGQFKTP